MTADRLVVPARLLAILLLVIPLLAILLLVIPLLAILLLAVPLLAILLLAVQPLAIAAGRAVALGERRNSRQNQLQALKGGSELAG